jgi:hypothetical protein
MRRRTALRLVLVALVVSSAVGFAGAWASRPRTVDPGPAEDVTVVTQQGRDQLPGPARAVAFGEDGDVVYEDDRYGAYFDVDPVEGTNRTIEYIAVDFERHRNCPERVSEKGDWCARNLVVRANITTGERRVVYERFLPKLHKLHDVDRIDEDTLVVGNIHDNQVEFVNTATGETTWTWNANESFAYPESGGTKGDWTHLNDVEMVRDGLVMVSLRNHDQVVFLDPEADGDPVVDELTLGCDGCYDVMFEQHNPDYIPAERGGPAVVLADSENDRIVEYRREGGEWERSWTWTSSEMAWPRDADRLPNGNTLITDSHANRVVEVAPNGSVVWSVTLGNPYEAERLGTGDESAGGHAHEPGAQLGDGDPVDRLLVAVRDALPSRAYSAAMFAMPYWVDLPVLLLAASGLLAALVLLALEGFWLLRERVVPRLRDLPAPGR